MSALPSKNSDLSVPTPISSALDRGLRVMASRMTAVGLGHEIAAVDAPTPEQRRDLQVRAASLDHWLRPSGDLALDEISAIFLMPARAVDAGDVKARMRLYERDLAAVPMFALSKACADFRQGRAGDGWRPSQAEIIHRAETYTQPTRAERLKIGQVLRATIVDIRDDPARRKAIADELRAVARAVSLAGQRAEAERAGHIFDDVVAPDTAPKPTETPLEALERLKQTASVPMTLSEEARRKHVARAGVDVDTSEEAWVRAEFEAQGGRAA